MKKKVKAGKKSRASAKKKVSVSSDEEQVSVVSSLPPAVEGQLRCFLRVSIGRLSWAIPQHPDDVRVRVRWWGDGGEGAILRPLKRKGEAIKADTQWTSVRYPVCSGPKQFAAYLKDMGTLVLDMVHGPAQLHLGQVLISEIVNLSASQPIHGFFPVMSPSRPSSKIAELHVTIKFESVSAAYNKLSSSIPTVDTGLDKENVHEDSAPHPTPPPYANPATPVTHPRHQASYTDPFASPAPVKGVKFSTDPPERLEYTIDPSVLSLLDGEMNQGGQGQGISTGSPVTGKPGLPTTDNTTLPDNHPGIVQPSYGHGNIDGMDWIGALLEKGQKLREGMVQTALLEDEDDDSKQSSGYLNRDDSPHNRHVLPGQLFKELLSNDNKSQHHFLSSDPLGHMDDHALSHLDDPTLDTEDKVIDLLMGDQDMEYLPGSPDTSDVSDELSKTGDPLYDESLLMDLFYTAPDNKAETDSDHDEMISTDNDDDGSGDDVDDVRRASIEDAGNRRPKRHHVSPKDILTRGQTRLKDGQKRRVKHWKPKKQEEDSDGKKYGSPTAQSFAHLDDDSTSTLTSTSTAENMIPSLSTGRPASDLVDRLGADTLTALGRVNTARVVIESLVLGQHAGMKGEGQRKKPSTFLVEYQFPAVAPAKDHGRHVAMATEVTRIASKKIQDGAVSFVHRSVFPVLFNASVVDQWWSLALTFRVFKRDSGQRQPAELGVGVLPLKTILQSSTLSQAADVEIKHKTRRPSDESNGTAPSSTQQPSSSSYQLGSDSDSPRKDRTVIGSLKVKVELGVDGKEVHVTPTSVPLSTTVIHPHPPTVAMVSRPVVIASSYTAQQQSGDPVIAKPPLPRGLQHTSQQANKQFLDTHADLPSEVHTLHSLLWIPEGKDVTSEPHSIHGNNTSAPSIAGRTNPYLVCRMFWCEDVSRSAVTWATNQPQFGFKQVAPVLLMPTLLQRACNNFIVVEVWDKSVPQGDKLIGIVKLPLHQLYLSYRDPKITKTLMKSKYPVVCVDEWCVISNPFTASQHGQLKVLLAMGTDDQISSLLAMRGGEEIPTHLQEKPSHHLDNHSGTSEQGNMQEMSKSSALVEHQFEMVVEDIQGLSVFRSTVWGETDCFVQYHFPHQNHEAAVSIQEEDVPSLKAHRTTTTLCVPDPSFQDIARHSFLLPSGVPVQRYLLASFSGSWTGLPSLPGMGGVPFELWRRYYYPNVRDQLVAKASLPVAKLCAMVTMQKHKEPSVQAFSLPLVVLPGDDQTTRQMVQDTGLLNIAVKYRQSKISSTDYDGMASKKQDQVCLSIEVIRACGLKSAAAAQAISHPSMSYPADVGVNAYVVIKLPVGRKSSYTTRTVARTFAPEFSHHMEVLEPVTATRKADVTDQEGPMSLAEKLETSEATLEVWHQLSRGPADVDHRRDDQPNHSRDDVLLGAVTVPLVELLTRRAGIRGWHSVLQPERTSYDEDDSNHRHGNRHHSDHHVTSNTKSIGGLQLSIKFVESDDREAVVHAGRSSGWCPRPGVEHDVEDLWGAGDEGPSARGVQILIRISRIWVPVSIARDFQGHTQTKRRDVLGYVRYKLNDKNPICSILVPLMESDNDLCRCDIKHSKSFVLAASSSLAWYLREETLEVQVWLGGRGGSSILPGRRDKLVGSGYIELSSLITQDRHRAEISGTYPLFKTGASDLAGASVHVQISLAKPSSTSEQYDDLEQDEAVDESFSTGYPSTDLGRINNDSSPGSSIKPCGTPRDQEQLVPSTPPRGNAEDKDTFAAHVIVQEARHLPLVPGTDGERVGPNVYISYQPTASSSPVSTSVATSSTDPVWEYQKLERLKLSTLKSQNLIFKVWHRAGVESNVEPPPRGSGEALMGDRALGFVSMDLAPLAAGLRELIGWYNVMTFSGECKGQMKVGVIPLTPVSPSRCLSTKSRLVFSPPRTNVSQTFSAAVTVVPSATHTSIAGHSSTQEDRTQLVDLLSDQISVHVENLKRLRSTRVTQHTSQEATQTGGLAVPESCSTSFLFGQLRRNVKDLETLQKGLQAKLRPGGEREHHPRRYSQDDLPIHSESQQDINHDLGGSAAVNYKMNEGKGKGLVPNDKGCDNDYSPIQLDHPSNDIESNPVRLNQHHDHDREDRTVLDNAFVPSAEEDNYVRRRSGDSDEYRLPSDSAEIEAVAKSNAVDDNNHGSPITETRADSNKESTANVPSHVNRVMKDAIGGLFVDLGPNSENTTDRLVNQQTPKSEDSQGADTLGGDSNDFDSDYEGDSSLGVSGYQGINTGNRFMEKDSWLSSEDESPSQSKMPVSARHIFEENVEIQNHEKRDDPNEETHYTTKTGGDDAAVGRRSFNESEEERTLSEHSDGDSDVEEAMSSENQNSNEKSPEVIESRSQSGDETSDHHGDNDANDYGNYSNDKGSDGSHDNRHAYDAAYSRMGGHVAAALPNFFMPTQQLEESMRALRLDAKLGRPYAMPKLDAQPQSRLLARAHLDEHRTEKHSEGIASEFARRKLKYKAKREDGPPITSLEAGRIARIFSSKGV